MSTTLFAPQQLPQRYQQMEPGEMKAIVQDIKERWGKHLVILGHHYQKDEVMTFADIRGDSLKLAQQGTAQAQAQSIVFCGVHFMAETADILSTDEQNVILPDLDAGCSMADMADIHQVERCWEALTDIYGDTIIPMTYVNSTADIKAFCGRHGGITCTSSNADRIFDWAFARKKRILFLPDEHLGRNTGVKKKIPFEQMAVWNPVTEQLEGTDDDHRLILWKGFCSVHQKFTPDHVQTVREKHPNMKVIVHPECMYEVVRLADVNGSTERIIREIEEAEPGSEWAVGTEVNLVQRLAREHPEQTITLLNDMICPCLTMNRIDLPHLTWALESMDDGEPINIIRVPEETATLAKTALDRMLEVS